MTTYSVKEVFKRLKSLKITSNEESVRRWLRTGKLKGYRNSKKEGWRVREEDLQPLLKRLFFLLLESAQSKASRLYRSKSPVSARFIFV